MPTDEQIAAKAEDVADPSPTPTGPDSLLGDSASKANKGMILRKSVDYIRYLQQLVGAHASRNRVLEAELAGYRGHTVDGESMPSQAELDALVLADGSFGADFTFDPSGPGYALHSVREDMDVEEYADGADRPGTAMTGVSSAMSAAGTSPSDGGDDDDDISIEEETRGRRGRDGRPHESVHVKTEGAE
jgi:hypothetical protein